MTTSYMTTMAAAPAVTYAAAPQMAYETVAAPQIQYAAAAPATYAAAPGVTYAAPMTYEPQMTYAAPVVTETVTAAPMTYAPQMQQQFTYAPPMTTQVPSYVAAPQAFMQAPAAPTAPMKLTEGIPTPEQISQQKAGYSAALDKQLKEAMDTVQKETQIEKEMIKFTADKTIALYNMQVDEKLTEAIAMADEQATFALLELNKAKVERNLQLNNQASGLIMDYQMKAVQTELAQKQYEFQVTYAKKENALMAEYNQQVVQANTGTTYSVPAQAVR